jgi:hypothetical protein
LRFARNIIVTVGALGLLGLTGCPAVYADFASGAVLPATGLGTGQIAGRVTSAAGKTPLEGVQVCEMEYGRDSVVGHCGVTNANGEYVLGGLAGGKYEVSFEPSESSGYVWQEYGAKEYSEEATPVAVEEEATTTGIDAELRKAGEIAGRVTSAVGKVPLEGVEVCVIAYEGWHWGGCASTNENGEYVLGGMTRGRYEVRFEPSGSSGYASQDYQAKTLAEAGTPVAVEEEATTTGIDAELHKAGEITGRVTSAVGKVPLEGVHVCEWNGTEDWSVSRCTTTDWNGEYQLSMLAPGNHAVRFEPREESGYVWQEYKDKARFEKPTLVAVGEGTTTTGIDAELRTPGEIAGRVTSAVGKAPLVGVRVCEAEYGAEQWEEDGWPAAWAGRCSSTGTNGEYQLFSLARGNYEVRFEPSESSGYLWQDYDAKALSEKATPVAVEEEATTSGIDAELRTDAPVPSGGGPSRAPAGSPLSSILFNLGARLTRRHGEVELPLRCADNAGACPAGRVQLSVIEHLKGGRVVAVTSTSKQRLRTRVIVIGTANVPALGVDTSVTIRVKLNSAGRRLARRYKRLPVRVHIRAGALTVMSSDALIT